MLWHLPTQVSGLAYYTMLAIFTLFLQAKFGYTAVETSTIFGGFLGLVYFMPLVGGILADKKGYGKMVTTGTRLYVHRLCFVGYSHFLCKRQTVNVRCFVFDCLRNRFI